MNKNFPEVARMTTKLFLFLFLAALCLFWAYALSMGIMLYEPSVEVARVETGMMLTVGFVSLCFAYMETRKP